MALLWLVLCTLPVLPKPLGVVPPKGCVVVQSQQHLSLQWPNAARKPRLRVWYGKQPMVDESAPSGTFRLRVRPGVKYLWSVSNEAGRQAEWLDFSVTDRFEVRVDGRTGDPGTSTKTATMGTTGGVLRARLSRDAAGVQLWILEGDQERHFLLNEPEKRFLLSARGGDGGPGYEGEDERIYVHERPGRRPQQPAHATAGGNGGDAGWGGRVELQTNLPNWQDYLEVDLEPGQPGQGGKGGLYVGTEVGSAVGKTFYKDSGKPGKPGQRGQLRVTTAP